MRKYFYTLICDKVTGKPSLTKHLTLIFSFLGVIGVLIAFGLMIWTSTIDHFVIGEVLTFVVTMSGIKNLVLSTSGKYDQKNEDTKQNYDNADER